MIILVGKHNFLMPIQNLTNFTTYKCRHHIHWHYMIYSPRWSQARDRFISLITVHLKLGYVSRSRWCDWERGQRGPASVSPKWLCHVAAFGDECPHSASRTRFLLSFRRKYSRGWEILLTLSSEQTASDHAGIATRSWMAKSSADDEELRWACEAAIEGTKQKVVMSIRVAKSHGTWVKAGKLGRGHMAKPRVLALSSTSSSPSRSFHCLIVWLDFFDYSDGFSINLYCLLWYKLNGHNAVSWTAVVVVVVHRSHDPETDCST